MRRTGVALLLAMAVACASGVERSDDGPTRGEAALPQTLLRETAPVRVVLVTVTGLTPAAALGHPGAPEMPTLRALARRGIVAEVVEPVAPASAYPVHTTLVTGRRPAAHGVPADRLLGRTGVRRALYSDASRVRGDTLWQVAAAGGVPVGALDWPATLGADLPLLLPDVSPTRRGETWQGLVGQSATPGVKTAVEARAAPGLGAPGGARDALLVDLACQALTAPSAPRLLLLRLRRPEPALAAEGPHGDAVRAAFAQVDADLAKLVGCLDQRRPFDATLVVVGDRVPLDIHTVIALNPALGRAGLIGGRGEAWSAIARSNGGSAFVYATSEGAALAAREVLEQEAERTRAFRIVPADEMIRLGVDREAWFGLEAHPGFAFTDATTGPRLRPAPIRASAGQLAHAGSPALVIYGLGIRPGLRVPRLAQVDVAPTVAALLGFELPGAEGRRQVGLLSLPAVSAGPAPTPRP